MLSLSSMRKDFNYMCHLSVKKCYQIHFFSQYISHSAQQELIKMMPTSGEIQATASPPYKVGSATVTKIWTQYNFCLRWPCRWPCRARLTSTQCMSACRKNVMTSWLHYKEMLSTLLALCKDSMQCFYILFVSSLNKLLNKQSNGHCQSSEMPWY